ncbi:hypothetical protein B7Y94_02920 [Candidatus Saccharibacteria bacterium 32-49-12]|nr:MAG: hypothetical protein B7Y94_02920 [Candidatus Saccharibacteria bacterium 32-49-12]
MIPSRRRQPESLPPRRRQVDQDTSSNLETESAAYRRNLTIRSPRHGTAAHPSQRQALHHLVNQRRRVGSLFVIVLGVSLMLFLLLTQFVAEATVTVPVADYSRSVAVEPYADTVREYYRERPIERFRFLLNEDSMTAYIVSEHPEVKAVEIAKVSDFVHAYFSVTLRQPVAGWQINTQDYYVDDLGVVFDDNFFGEPQVQIVDDSGITPEKGTSVASSRLLSFVGRLSAAAKSRGYVLESVMLPVGSTRQLEVKLAQVGSAIRVSVDRGAGEQMEDADRAWRYLQSKGRTPRYIDVRIPERAVYR